ncbi:hypothetical protein I603_0382 [Erythrobacter dokdonensis DSW-74]|uniref:Uncharacterized protein n=1 Tax=Erythrobacter dokdonensis DSW-74 TaxID=1300349 RepID=A0A1A7BKK0_9SPHN|nr:hypothetical protein I603_0382 [Erythrobacter dokdonensis DSW-74]
MHETRLILRAAQSKITLWRDFGPQAPRRFRKRERATGPQARLRARSGSAAKRRTHSEHVLAEARTQDTNEKGVPSPSVETPFHGQRPGSAAHEASRGNGLPVVPRAETCRPLC